MTPESPVSSRDAAFSREALALLPDVARYAKSLTRDASEADDLVQDTFMMAYQAWDQYTPGTECRAWLFTICRRRFLRVRRGAERYVATEDAELESLGAADVYTRAHTEGLDHVFERSEMREAVEAAMESLPEAFRDVAVLVDLHDHSYESAAEILGIPLGTVRSRLFRARRMLQEQLLAFAQDAGFGVQRAAEGSS
ncbi:MAG TPA: sigma-70 family RNA polymerase sigma factor [Gemmatimonadaceae bacterium]|jgi:RNA polymerase sigma-70 factor (ECF subfamily)